MTHNDRAGKEVAYGPALVVTGNSLNDFCDYLLENERIWNREPSTVLAKSPLSFLNLLLPKPTNKMFSGAAYFLLLVFSCGKE